MSLTLFTEYGDSNFICVLAYTQKKWPNSISKRFGKCTNSLVVLDCLQWKKKMKKKYNWIHWMLTFAYVFSFGFHFKIRMTKWFNVKRTRKKGRYLLLKCDFLPKIAFANVLRYLEITLKKAMGFKHETI